MPQVAPDTGFSSDGPNKGDDAGATSNVATSGNRVVLSDSAFNDKEFAEAMKAFDFDGSGQVNVAVGG